MIPRRIITRPMSIRITALFSVRLVQALDRDSKGHDSQDDYHGEDKKEVVYQKIWNTVCNAHAVREEREYCQVNPPVQGSSNIPTRTPRISAPGREIFFT